MTEEKLVERMLSGQPFTYGGLCATWGEAVNETRTRLIDRTIQKLRRAGKIAYRREGRSAVWLPTSSAEPAK